MIEGRRLLGLIPARGGSKGIPGKNLIHVGGKPLLAWTVEAAKRCRYLDRLILSSDDPKICEQAERLGCDVPFLRPAELAADDTPGIAPVLHCLEVLEADYDGVVLLQPTSPLRLVSDIDGAIELWHRKGAMSCVSVCEPQKSPYWSFSMDSDGLLHPLFPDLPPRRQDLPVAVGLNGAIYVADATWLRESRSFVGESTCGFEMPAERSIDIDTPTDLTLVEALLASRSS